MWKRAKKKKLCCVYMRSCNTLLPVLLSLRRLEDYLRCHHQDAVLLLRGRVSHWPEAHQLTSQAQRTSCFHLSSAGNTSVCYHAHLLQALENGTGLRSWLLFARQAFPSEPFPQSHYFLRFFFMIFKMCPCVYLCGSMCM